MKSNILAFLFFFISFAAVSATHTDQLNDIAAEVPIPEAQTAESYISEADSFDESLPDHEHEIYGGVLDENTDDVRQENYYLEDLADLPDDEKHDHSHDEQYGDEYNNVGEDREGEEGYDGADDDLGQEEGFNDWDMYGWGGHDEL